MKMKTSLLRQSGLDIIKALAVFFVLAVHFFYNTHFYRTPLAGTDMGLQTFMRMTFLMCVPLFLILTGYLQANKEPRKGHFKKLIPIILIYLLYAMAAAVVREFYLGEHKSLVEWAKEIVTFRADGYAWYINMYIGLFLLSPYLNLIYKGLNTQKDKCILIGVLLLLTALPELTNGKAGGYVHFPDWWKTIYPITYYFIGNFIREYQFKVKKYKVFFVWLITCLLTVCLELHAAQGNVFRGISGYYGSLLVVIMSVSFFLLLYQCHIKNTFFSKGVAIISVLSLDIYLASYITDRIIYKELMEHTFQSQQQILHYFVPVVAASFGIAFIIGFIRHKCIPLR